MRSPPARQFNAAFAIFPLLAAPLSDSVGRNPVYLACYFCFVLFFIPLAWARNIWTIIVRRRHSCLLPTSPADAPPPPHQIARFFSGCFGAAGTTLIGGGLADMWVTSERSVPMVSLRVHGLNRPVPADATSSLFPGRLFVSRRLSARQHARAD